MIDQNRRAFDRNRPQAKITVYGVQRLSPALQLQFQIIEKRIIERPKSFFGQFEYERRIATRCGSGGCGDGLAVHERGGFDRNALGCSIDFDTRIRAPVVGIGCNENVANERRADAFEPDRLPDAGCSCVYASVAFLFLRLFAAGLEAAARVVEGMDDYGVLAGHERIGHVKRKRGAAARMTAHEFPIDPHPCAPVARADMEPHPRRLPRLGNREGSAVPYVFDEAAPFESREFALAAERNHDPVGIRLFR